MFFLFDKFRSKKCDYFRRQGEREGVHNERLFGLTSRVCLLRACVRVCGGTGFFHPFFSFLMRVKHERAYKDVEKCMVPRQ